MADDAGRRTDVVIARVADAPRSIVADAMKSDRVHVNGVAVKPSTLLEEGDEIEFELRHRAPLVVLPESIPLSIVYEDDDLLVVDKPAGMVTHPAHGSRGGTLVNALLAHAGPLPGEATRGGLVHRLDRDTSGLLVVAKTADALSSLGKAMQRRFIKREYRGIVTGEPDATEGTIEGPIGRDPQNRLRYAIRDDGKPAITHYALRERLNGSSELTFRLETGRTHQIRVHFAAVNHPLLNDPLYGRSDPRVRTPGQALHAWRLGFRHPRTGEELAFEAPPPPDYEATLTALRR